MSTIKNLLIYSVSLIALFSLTAISCDDLGDVELPDISAPMTIEESVEIKTDGATDTSMIKTIDTESPEIQEYKDRLEKFEADSAVIEVIDNGSVGTASGGLYMMLGGTKYPMHPDGIVNNIKELDGYSMDFSTYDGLKESIENHIVNTEPMETELEVQSNDAVDYSIKITIYGVITASAN